MLNLTLGVVHPDPSACEAFRTRFHGLARFEVVCGRYAELPPHDAFVTAGNAYGIMTAGIDAAVVDFHGEPLMAAVQDRIRNDYLGEQPVGTAFVVPTGTPDRPFLVHAPTMRMPGGISGTDQVYTATWAALLAVYRHNVAAERPIRTVFAPAMGTGFGAMPFDESARQMAAAWRHFLHPASRLDWDQAIARERTITTDAGRVVAR
ncbi:MAG: macro domain-containing protein [Myxococcota bacterium]